MTTTTSRRSLRSVLRSSAAGGLALALTAGGLTALAPPASAATTTFAVSGIATPVAVGEPVDVTVTALNADGTIDEAYTGAVLLTSDSPGSTPVSYTFGTPDLGVHTVQGAFSFGTASPDAATTYKVTATDATGVTGASSGTAVASPSAVNSLLVTGVPTPVTRPSTVKVTVSALTLQGAVARAAAGTVSLTDGVSTASGDLVLGKAVISFPLAPTPGARTLSATLSGSSAVGSAPYAVLASATTALAVEGLPSTVRARTPQTLSVYAVDQQGLVDTSYTGEIALSTSDAAGTVPTSVVLTAADAGRKTVPGVVLRTEAVQSVTATDGTRSASTVTSVLPGDAVVAPGAPTGVSATAGDAQATVRFTAPVEDGGSAVRSYTVTATPAAGGTAVIRTVNAPASTAVVTGLTNGTAYVFTVVATNSAGNGPSSEPSAPVTPTRVATAPSAPTGAAASARDRSAVVTWRAPIDNGGSAITGYVITASPGGRTVTAGATATTATVTGLVNGTSYTFRVQARNAIGLSSASAVSNAVVPRGRSTLGISASRTTLIAGTSVTFTTVLRGSAGQALPGKAVVLTAVRDRTTTAVVVFRGTTSSTGAVTAVLRPAANGNYTWRFAGDAASFASVSAVRRVTVAPKLTIIAPSTGVATSRLVVTGTVTPKKPGSVVTLFRRSSTGVLTKIGSGTVTSTGTYRISVLLRRGSYTLVTKIGATTGNLAGTSPLKSVRRT